MNNKPITEAKYKISVQITGFLFFSFLFTLSWIFFKERMLCFDPAFFLFKLIEYEEFVIEFGRWGSVPSQLIPLWAIKNEFPLETVMKLYSVSFILIFYLIFLVITLVLNNYKAGLALLVALCIGFRQTFYYSTGELYQGMALAIVVWALIAPENEYNSKAKKWMSALISALLIYAISYYHQLTLFAVLFFISIEIISKRSIKNIPLFTSFAFTLVWFFIRVFFLSETAYEKEKIIDSKIFFEQLPHLFQLSSTVFYKEFVTNNLFSFSISLGLILFLLIYKKKWPLLFFSMLYFTGYFLLVVITFHNGESPIVLEHYFTAYSFFVAVILMVLLNEKFSIYWTFLIVVPLLILNLKEVFASHHFLTKRVEYMERLITYGRTFEKRKFLLHNRNFPKDYAGISWTLPFETTMLSSLKSPDSTLTFFTGEDMNKYNSLIEKENIFLGAGWDLIRFTSDNLNKNYFRLPSSGYEKLASYQSDTAFKEADFDTSNVKIIPFQPTMYCDAGTYTVGEFNIINESGKKLTSINDGNNPVYLSYHIYDLQGNIVVWDGLRSVLEVDIEKKYKQGLSILVPPKSGKYIVAVDFVTEWKRWWEINSRFNLIVD